MTCHSRAALVATLFITSGAWAQSCADLVAHWTFENHTLDVSSFGNHGSPSGTISYVAGREGRGLFLNGAGQVVVPNSTSLNPAGAITVSAWYLPVPFVGSGNDGIVDKGAASHNSPYYQYHLGVAGLQYGSPGLIGFNVMGLGGASTGYNFYSAGQWYHIVGTYDGSEVRLYVNGVLIDQNPFTVPMTDFGRPLVIGGFSNLNLNLFGTVDEIRILNRAISAEEAAALFESPGGRPVVFPRQASLCNGGSTTLRAVNFEGAGAAYQWFRNGEAIADEPGHISGSTAMELVIVNAVMADEGQYTCVVSGGCAGGSLETEPRLVRFCVGDFTCDGSVDGDDVIAFFDVWDQGSIAGDVNGDGGVDGDDVILFFERWDSGC